MVNSSRCVKIYDSLYTTMDEATRKVVSNSFGSLIPELVNIPKQSGGTDCGLYAIANATALCFQQDPSKIQFHQNVMRLHLIKCMEDGELAPFPTK